MVMIMMMMMISGSPEVGFKDKERRARFLNPAPAGDLLLGLLVVL